ncbi:MAG: hypothetical protein JHD15_14385 [Phenylobacterium sp.]|uniref:hypothetical protein n=1 Tax=Phenylobacterium sp. TaxID=1871053 RepID=UPI001A230788|nr:hypothetical protein [Phenylobacterium sp.]MBJ7411535.1 hypothetical protein [Phenylobacterium sp.]
MRRVLAALALASLLLGGCQTLPRVPYALETLHAASPDYRYNFIEPGTSVRFLGDIGGVGREHPSGELQLLPLSGGGANGAYGAGVMYGWGRRGDRPEFDVVTRTTRAARVFTLLNSRTTPRFAVVPVGGLKIIARSFDTMLKSLTRSELTNVKLAASDKGLKLEVGEIPDGLDENFLDFSRPHMQALFAAGEQQGLAATAFRTVSPAPVAPLHGVRLEPFREPIGTTDGLAAPGSPVASGWLRARRNSLGRKQAGLMFAVRRPIVGVQTGSPRLEPRQVATRPLRLTHGLPRPFRSGRRSDLQAYAWRSAESPTRNS